MSLRIRGLLGLLAALGAGSTIADNQWHGAVALSPDGQTIAFTHRGDIYRVSSAGGSATPVTATAATEGHPTWSSDGRWLAYTSDRHGNLDVFIAPSEGGLERRLTFYSGDDVVTDFSADNQRVLFSSARHDALNSPADPHRDRPELYEVGIAGGTPVQVTTVEARQARWDSQGTTLLYADEKGDSFYRKHDDSPFARDVWRLSTTEGRADRLTSNPWNDHTPAWDETGDGFYFLSERSGTINVWHQVSSADETSAQQLTFHEQHPVRSLSVSRAGDIAYSLLGQIHFGRPGQDPTPVDVTLGTAVNTQLTRIAADAQITEFAVSPNDREIAYVVRGDVFVTSLEFATTRQITRTPGLERNIAFDDDGRAIVYAAERMDQWRIFESRMTDEEEEYFFLATQIDERLIVGAPDSGTDRALAATMPKPSPDGRFLAYLVDFAEIRVFDRATKSSETLVPASMNFSLGNSDITYSWSPDSRYLAVDIQPDGRLFFPNVAIVPIDDPDDLVDLTQSGYADGAPQWHSTGGIITWMTGRYGPREHGGHGTHWDVFAQFLNQDAWDDFRRSKEEIAIQEAEECDEDEDLCDNGAEEDAIESVRFESEGASDRQTRLTIHSSQLSGFALTSDATKLYYLSAFESGFDLWAHDFREEETSKVVAMNADSASLALVSDDSAAVVLSDGVLHKIDLEADDPSADQIPITATMEIDTDAERAAMLHHIWQTTRDRLYLPDVLAEADWDQMYAAYAAKLPAISNNRDFVSIINELVGELDVSHAYARYRPDGTLDDDETAAIGAVLTHSGGEEPATRVAHIFHQGPLAKASDRAASGNRIVAIDNIRLDATTNYYALMRNRNGAPVRLTLADREGEFDVVLRPTSVDAEREWAYQRWVESRHLLVEDLSAGRLGYVYIPQMSDEAYRRVYRDLFGRHFTKEAVVIDVRDNGGGDLVDWLIQLFSGTQYMWNVPDGRTAQGEPITEWVKPSIVLTNESAYSDGHCFVASWKNLSVGQLVGSPVPGTCTYAGWESLASGDIRAGTPRLGIKDADGDWMERKTTYPDIRIDADPASVMAGRDVQLEAAVAALLSQLEQ